MLWPCAALAKAKATAAAAKAEAKAAKDGGGSASPRPAGGLPPVLDDAAAAVSPASAGAVALAVGRSSAGTSESAQLDATILTLNRRYDRLITLLSSFMTLLTSNVFFMLILPLSRFGPNKASRIAPLQPAVCSLTAASPLPLLSLAFRITCLMMRRSWPRPTSSAL